MIDETKFNSEKGVTRYTVDNEIAKIALIVGHSEEDEGAESPSTGLTEYDYNLPVANEAAKHFNEIGISCDVYRRDYQEQWVNMAKEHVNSVQYDLVIMLHLNCYKGHSEGSEVLYWSDSVLGQLAAENLLESILSCFGGNGRGIKAIKRGERTWFMLWVLRAPAIIVEAKFIDDPEDEERLRKYWSDYDEAIVKGVVRFLEERDIEID